MFSKLAAAAAESPPLVGVACGGGGRGVTGAVVMGGETFGATTGGVLAMEASVWTSEFISGATCAGLLPTMGTGGGAKGGGVGTSVACWIRGVDCDDAIKRFGVEASAGTEAERRGGLELMVGTTVCWLGGAGVVKRGLFVRL